jgi:hypothetical protein
MSKTIKDTRTLLDALRVEIQRKHFESARPSRRIVAWKGPGSAFMTKPKFTTQATFGLRGEPIAVITPHAHAAAWLLERLDLAFAPLLGNQLRWDFFERIGEAVNGCGAFIPIVTDSAVDLLLLVLREASDILEEMEAGEFPYVHSADQVDD